MNFTYNDAEPVPRSHEPGPIERHCHACIYLAGGLDAPSRRGRRGATIPGAVPQRGVAGLASAKEALHELAVFCRARGIKLLVASFPELHGVGEPALRRIAALGAACAWTASPAARAGLIAAPVSRHPSRPSPHWGRSGSRRQSGPSKGRTAMGMQNALLGRMTGLRAIIDRLDPPHPGALPCGRDAQRAAARTTWREKWRNGRRATPSGAVAAISSGGSRKPCRRRGFDPISGLADHDHPCLAGSSEMCACQ